MSDGWIFLSCDEAHYVLHTFKPDFDETVTIALTEHDIGLIGIALGAIGALWPCLNEENIALQERIKEIVSVQMPEWLRENGT